MIYLDHAATSFPKAPGVAEAITAFLAESAANPGRAGHRMAVEAERMVDRVRRRLVNICGGSDPASLILTLNGTDALNIAIHGVLWPSISTGEMTPHVITTCLEHNSVSRPLETLYQRGDITLTRVTCSDDGFINPEEVADSITPATRLVVVTHASNVLGTVQPVAEVGRAVREAREKGDGEWPVFLLDAAQTMGLIPVNASEIGADLVAFPGHKSLLGPTGTGGLYLGERFSTWNEDAPPLAPFRIGGTGGDSATATQPPQLPFFLEAGTPNTTGLAGLLAALEHLDTTTPTTPPTSRLAHEHTLIAPLLDYLHTDENLTLYGPRDVTQRTGTVAFNITGYDPADAAAILDQSFNIALRPGLHCAPYLHRRLNTFPIGTLRASVGPSNTQADITALIEALQAMTG